MSDSVGSECCAEEVRGTEYRCACIKCEAKNTSERIREEFEFLDKKFPSEKKDE